MTESQGYLKSEFEKRDELRSLHKRIAELEAQLLNMQGERNEALADCAALDVKCEILLLDCGRMWEALNVVVSPMDEDSHYYHQGEIKLIDALAPKYGPKGSNHANRIHEDIR